MATWSDDFSVPGTTARVRLVLEVTVASQNITNNTSTLSWKLRMEEYVNGSPFRNFNDCVASAAVNGTVYSASNLNYNFDANNETINVASGSRVVTHNADGTKTISVSASYNGHNPLGTASISASMVLPTIPRATQPTVSPTSGQTGQTFTIGHAAASNSFYHDVAYSLDGGDSYTNIQTGIVGTDPSTPWTPAHSLLPNSTSATAIIRVITRASAGGTIIGTKTVNLPLTVPSSVKPSISAVSWAEAQTASPDMPTLMGGAGRFVQRWSKLQPTVTATGSGGSSVTGASVTQNGQTTPSGSAFGSAIALSGSVPYTAVAVDTRGRSSDTFLGTVTVKAYNYPSLPTPAVTRTSDAGGTTPSPTGTYLRITPNASVSSLDFGDGEKNLLEWRIRTRLKSSPTWTTVQDWTTATVVGTTWTASQVIAGYAANSEYEVEVSIRDLFGKNGFSTSQTVVSLSVPVPTESVFMDWDEGIGIGLGKYRQSGILDINGEVNIDGDLAIEDGTVTVDGADVMQAASITQQGRVELATNAETLTGTDTTRAVTPASFKSALNDATNGYRLRQIVKFESSSTFNKASYPWLRAIRVRCQAGGGAGGGKTTASGASGGGGGEYAESFITNIDGLDSSVTVTVGAGGNGNTGNGSDGGNSSFGSLVIANGGKSSTGGGVDPGPGGTGGTGDLLIAGGGGASGSRFAIGSGYFGGNGGNAHLGGGAWGRVTSTSNQDGVDADNYGGGGSGARGNGGDRIGGSGGDGVVIVELYA